MKAFLWSESHHKNDTLLRCPLGFLTAISKKKKPTQLTTNWKQKSHGLKNVSVSGVSKQPCLLVKASDLLLVSGWLKPWVFYFGINWNCSHTDGLYYHQPDLTNPTVHVLHETSMKERNKDLCLIFALHKAFYQQHQKITPTSTISYFLTNYFNNPKAFIQNEQLVFN